jgi:uncharacterized membrane protein
MSPVMTTVDLIALIWFFASWLLFSVIADHPRSGVRTLNRASRAYRNEWMLRMIERGEMRMVDSTLIASLMRSVSFFASTSIFIIAGLIAVLGATDRAIALAAQLPFAIEASRALWEIKVIVLLGVFIYAFFKFTWSLRQFNLCIILIGAAPLRFESDDELFCYAETAGRVNFRAGNHFNQGIRAYYFGLGVLSWFINPWAFMAVTALVVAVQYRRERASATLRALHYAGSRRGLSGVDRE